MPRQSRKPSSSQIYHVMVRGNEKKDIFLDDVDRARFLDILRNKKREAEYLLYAYCLMGNHVHLLVKEEGQKIAQVMRRINVSYAFYFNQKYNRTGHVFQDRYKSEPVDTEGYLLTVLRYIHNNPVKAGLVTEPAGYRWSSFLEYVDPDRAMFVDTGEVLGIFSQNQKEALKAFAEYSGSGDNLNTFAENELDSVPTSESLLHDFFVARNLNMDMVKAKKNLRLRNELISYLRDGGLTVKVIAQLVGLNKNTVCSVIKGGSTAKIVQKG